MIAVIQKVSEASVTIAGQLSSEISQGLLILLGIEDADTDEDVQWLARKIVHLRIFSDHDDKMNESLMDVQGELLVVSQFTLHASTKKGNRPSYVRAAKPDHAIPMYEKFVREIATYGRPVKTGEFGAHMKVSLLNDGPVTIIIDTKNKQ